jgi:formylglycine-generating enzyme required for sulfatase activity
MARTAGADVARSVRCAVFVALSSALVACATVAGIDDLVIGECKGGVCGIDSGEDERPERDDSGAVLPDDSGVPCTGKPLPPSVRVGAPGNTFCIDSTEVTNAQYQEFLAANVPIGSQPPECAWNETFAPELPEPVETGAAEPVVGIDWCDALAYCTWAGKYLCGRVENGKKVGPVTLETSSDFHSHQWMNACSADARLRYPYGAIHEPGRCNLRDFDAGRPVAVGTALGCEGGYKGVYDLVGNVWEWYDGPCADGGPDPDGGVPGPEGDLCWLKGGSYRFSGASYDCRYDRQSVRRDSKEVDIGFRCCSD